MCIYILCIYIYIYILCVYIYILYVYIYIYGATRELPNFQGDPKIECPCKLMGIRSRPLLNSIVSRSQLWDREVNLIICSMSGVINPLIGIYIQGVCRILTIGWMSIDHIYIYMSTHHVMILAHMCIIDTEKNSCTSIIAIYIYVCMYICVYIYVCVNIYIYVCVVSSH